MKLPEFNILSDDYINCPEQNYEDWLFSGYALAMPFRTVCITRYTNARDVYNDQKRFSSEAIWRFFDFVNGTTGGPLGIPLVSLDDPEHARLRGVIRRAFDRTRSFDFEGKLKSLARETINSRRLRGETTLEVNSQVIAPYIFGAMFHFLGVDGPLNVAKVAAWSESVRSPLPLLRDNERKDVLRAQSEVTQFLRDRLNIPAADEESVIGQVQIGISNGDCTKEEGLALCRFLFYASNQTTRLSLSSIIKILATQADLLPMLKANMDLLPTFIHECLRLEPATQVSLRSAREKIVIAGQKLAEGDFIFIHNGCANRDRNVFENPNTLNLIRANASAHLTFGSGFHRCLGTQIALKEITYLLTELISCVSHIELEPNNPFAYSPKMFLRGPEYLQVAIHWK